jgi:hypothetical protein
MRNTTGETGGKSIVVLLQPLLGIYTDMSVNIVKGSYGDARLNFLN